MQNRAKVGIGVVVLVVASSVLGLSLTRSRLEPIPKPSQCDPVSRVGCEIVVDTHSIRFLAETDAVHTTSLPEGHEHDWPVGGIYTTDHQSILAIFRHELPPFREQETWEVLLNHKWPKARWEFWQFPLDPKSPPRLLATRDTDLSAEVYEHPGFLGCLPDGATTTYVVSTSWEADPYYRLRL